MILKKIFKDLGWIGAGEGTLYYNQTRISSYKPLAGLIGK